MEELLKNHMLRIFIMAAFFLSQVVNANANHLKNDPQHENIPVSVMEQGKKKTINIAAFYVPDINHGAGNEATIEGKIEKVFEPITLGIFTTVGSLGFGFLTGFVMSIFSAVIGWAISAVKKR
ncbi:hypothetical protein HNQ69_000652 [Bartonella callosciuri]|uniref:Protein-disulfide reductase n=1 Tax=Bartonella callosciuri TaxID=686223 RepID=A0A840NR26_9HYPH|nr:hypothetical protein [Bartonella callosciuri]MBB5073531.1 hypothetical protein [Bartonella callosciuri]